MGAPASNLLPSITPSSLVDDYRIGAIMVRAILRTLPARCCQHGTADWLCDRTLPILRQILLQHNTIVRARTIALCKAWLRNSRSALSHVAARRYKKSSVRNATCDDARFRLQASGVVCLSHWYPLSHPTFEPQFPALSYIHAPAHLRHSGLIFFHSHTSLVPLFHSLVTSWWAGSLFLA